jgi:outer membrane protein assembly factor BamA
MKRGLLCALLFAGIFPTHAQGQMEAASWQAGVKLRQEQIEALETIYPEIRVRHIAVEGNKRTKTRIILQELLFKENERVTAAMAQESRRLVRNLGIFQSVEFVFVTLEEEGALDLLIRVRERWTLLPEFDFTRKPTGRSEAGASLKEHNFLGRNQTLELEATYAGADDFDIPLGWQYKLAFDEPRIRGSAWGLGVFAKRRFDFVREYDSSGSILLSEYVLRSDSLGGAISWRLRPRHFLGFGGDYSRRRHEPYSGAAPPRDVHLVGLGPSYRWKRANEHPWFTYSGFTLQASLKGYSGAWGSGEDAATGDVAFLRYWRWHSLSYTALRLTAGHKFYGGSDFDMKLGGFGGLRGYDSGQFRGDDFWLVNLEERIALGKPFWKNRLLARLALFADAGQTQFGLLAEPDEWKIGLGGGLRLYAQRVRGGILSFDAAYGLDEGDWKFSVDIGESF